MRSVARGSRRKVRVTASAAGGETEKPEERVLVERGEKPHAYSRPSVMESPSRFVTV